MPAHPPLVHRVGATGLVVGLVVGLLAGCGSDERRAGEPITADDAAVLAGLLHRNHEEGGADFVATVPFSEDAVLTLTGEIDFRRAVGQAQAVTTVDDQEVDTRTLFFDQDELWTGDLPGLTDALAGDGAPAASYLRRPLPAGTPESPLIDVVVQALQNLTAETADEPETFLAGPYRWQGEQAIDGRPTTVYQLREGRTVAVDDVDTTLVQYRSPLRDGGAELTITLADHGDRRLALPTEEETAAAADHPGIADTFGV